MYLTTTSTCQRTRVKHVQQENEGHHGRQDGRDSQSSKWDYGNDKWYEEYDKRYEECDKWYKDDNKWYGCDWRKESYNDYHKKYSSDEHTYHKWYS